VTKFGFYTNSTHIKRKEFIVSMPFV